MRAPSAESLENTQKKGVNCITQFITCIPGEINQINFDVRIITLMMSASGVPAKLMHRRFGMEEKPTIIEEMVYLRCPSFGNLNTST
jgi:hypothetical protein